MNKGRTPTIRLQESMASRVAGRVVSVFVVAAACIALSTAWAEDMSSHHHGHHGQSAAKGTKRSVENYSLPSVSLVRQDGKPVALATEVDDGRPVLLNFIYTSCTAICPVTTQVFSQIQDKLGADADRLHMVSISIDPEYDTPQRLDEFSRKYHAGKQWNFYTSSRGDSIAIQKAFGAYRGDKMNHVPVTYLRIAPGKPWTRLDGLVGPDEVIKEYRTLVNNG